MRRVSGDALQGVDAADPYIDLGVPKLVNSTGVALSDLAFPEDLLRLSGYPYLTRAELAQEISDRLGFA